MPRIETNPKPRTFTERMDQLLETREKLHRTFNLLLDCCKMSYSKHVLNDPRIGWNELSDELALTLAEVMGDEEFSKWIKETKRIKDGKEESR